jgi:hypothetical protein
VSLAGTAAFGRKWGWSTAGDATRLSSVSDDERCDHLACDLAGLVWVGEVDRRGRHQNERDEQATD